MIIRCKLCGKEFKRKPSEISNNNFCNKKCFSEYRKIIRDGDDMKLSRFFKASWTNLNIRAGKYRHLSSLNKNKCYKNINVNISREEFKELCIKNKELILSLNRPSVDRINSDEDYSLNNIRFIELIDNIKNKRRGNKFINSNIKRGVRKIKNKFYARININKKEIYLGSFDNEEDAYKCFYDYYLKHYNVKPW